MAKNVRFLYDDKAENATIAATSEASGFPATSAVDLDRTSVWLAAAAGAQDLVIDLGAAYPIGGLGLANHNLGTLTGTQSVRASTDNFAASDVAIKTLAPAATDDYYADFGGVQTYRYWKVRTNATGAQRAQIGEIYFGTFVEMAVNPDVGWKEKDIFVDLNSQAISGVKVYKETGRAVRGFSGKWNPTNTALKDSIRTILLAQRGALKPFFYIPRADSSTPTEGLAYFVRYAGNEWDQEEIFANGVWGITLDLEEQQ